MPASSPDNRFARHPVLTGLVISLGLLVLAIALAEVVLARLRPAQRPWLESVAPGRHVQLREYPPDSRTYFSATPVRQAASGQPSSTYVVVTDADGCIRPSNLHAAPDLSIVFLGGSTTEGALIEAGKRWPERTVAQLEELLGLEVNGCNAGRSGANVVHSTVKLLAAFVPRSIDIAVLKHGINDLGLLTREGTYWPADDWHFSQVRTEEYSVEQGIRVLRNTLIPSLYEAVRQPRHGADAVIGDLGLSLGLPSARASPLVLPIPHRRGEPGAVAARLEAFERAVVAFVRAATLGESSRCSSRNIWRPSRRRPLWEDSWTADGWPSWGSIRDRSGASTICSMRRCAGPPAPRTPPSSIWPHTSRRPAGGSASRSTPSPTTACTITRKAPTGRCSSRSASLARIVEQSPRARSPR